MTFRLLFLLLVVPAAVHAQETSRWERRAAAVTITRDDWGIAHVRGRTDADAVFGMMYAQAEDDFNRIETNFLNAMGRLAEAEGESRIFLDLRTRLFIDPDTLRALYRRAPRSLVALMDAWADGLNFYLARHPEVRPRVITRFEPWMALSFSEGSIGTDIEQVSDTSVARFYGGDVPQPRAPTSADSEPRGSNGIAIAPSNTRSGHALLLINPHTSFYFRSELQVTSDEGLNMYGAATWGQFFIYQGFNERSGWIHTTSGVDNIDEYAERVERRGGRWMYRYGNAWLPVRAKTIAVRYRSSSGMASRSFMVFGTRHGPVVRTVRGQWIAVRLKNDPVNALMQSFGRMKTQGYDAFRALMERYHTNTSNNTVYADAGGNIALFHSNFIPRRDTSFDWTRPVDGSDPRAEWGAPLTVGESPLVHNPSTGWLYNSNDAPWWAAGAASQRREDFPRYVERGGWHARGRHAVLVLQDRRDFTIESLRDAAYDSFLPWFDRTVPALIAAFDSTPPGALTQRLREPVDSLRAWNRRWDTRSVATSVAVFWGREISRVLAREARRRRLDAEDLIAGGAPAATQLAALAAALDTLTADYGTWRTPWGEINRFQRLTGDIVHPFDDAAPSLPVGFTSARWGSLASYGAEPRPGTKKWYGTSGNSFVAIVEFGDSVRAVAVTAGGESGHPGDRHFNDQADRYATGNLRPVYFYPSQLVGHTERVYRPGD